MEKILLDSLRTGYLNSSHISDHRYRPEILINDYKNEKKVLTSILSLLHQCQEFTFSVAFLTMGGLAVLRNTLDELQLKGVKGTIIVSKYLNFTDPNALNGLLQYDNIELRIDVTSNFHAKCYTFKCNNQYSIIIGSSNLTDNALTLNYEFNIKINSLENGELTQQILQEQHKILANSILVTLDFIETYKAEYKQIRAIQKESYKKLEELNNEVIIPNSMQKEALSNLNALREKGANKALLISATGTGKTYFSAFDVKELQAKKILFIVHRSNIASKTMKSFYKIIGKQLDSGEVVRYGMQDGTIKSIEENYIFSTVQTMSLDQNLTKFKQDHFDYIIIDETHRAAAKTYQKVLNYFRPKFLLGMTATPERTDAQDIYSLFDHNIAYEIRLHQALEANLLTTFHYYGITDISINGEVVEEKTAFNTLIEQTRVNHILNKIDHYSTDSGEYRGLVFCSQIQEAESLAAQFTAKGYPSIALSGNNKETEREKAIINLESDLEDRIQFIFTVDIFNEGIDIPKVNMIIMLRATQSSIIFIQQLGRGLRKAEGKSYVTILDFIGNYNNNYLIPIALFGDTTYNKDHLRKTLSEGSVLIPGASTVEFDTISKSRIFESIKNARLNVKKDLEQDYLILKYKLNRIPLMMDFVNHGARDPYLYVQIYKSYYNAVKTFEKIEANEIALSESLEKIVMYFDSEINNAKRIIETFILHQLVTTNVALSINQLKADFYDLFKHEISTTDIESAIRNINFDYCTINYKETPSTKRKKVTYRNSDYLDDPQLYDVLIKGDHQIKLTTQYKKLIENNTFKTYLVDSINTALSKYRTKLEKSNYQVVDGFILYEKYSRKDVYRILNETSSPVELNIGGYKINELKNAFPIFVNYHKEDNISDTTKYQDRFVDMSTFEWMSKSKRTLESPEIIQLKMYKENKIKILLFIQKGKEMEDSIKKNKDNDRELYFMGKMTPIEGSYLQTTMPANEREVNVVKVDFKLDIPVKDSLYKYIISQ